MTGFRRARLTGQDALGLFPMPFTLRLWNLAEAEYYRLCAAKEIAVQAEDSVLAAGKDGPGQMEGRVPGGTRPGEVRERG